MAKSYLGALNHPKYGGEVLKGFGVSEENLLGEGRHSRVFRIDKIHVLRIYSSLISFEYVESLNNFYNTVNSTQAKFQIPEIDEFGYRNDFIFSIEKNLGQSMGFALKTFDSIFEEKIVDEYVSIIGKVADLKHPKAVQYGELIGDDLIVSQSWGDYLSQRADYQLNKVSSPEIINSITNFDDLLHSWHENLNSLPDPEKELIHGDIFPGNLMVDDAGSVSSVIDFSPMSVIGDVAMDVVTAQIQLAFSRFNEDQVLKVKEKIYTNYTIDKNIFWMYEIFVYLYYLPDSRETMREWASDNLARLANDL